MDVLGNGVYSIRHAAELTRLKSARVRAWFRGRDSTGPETAMTFQSDYPILEDECAISFLDLIDLYLVGRLREARISLRLIRGNYNHLRQELGAHPFAAQEVFESDEAIFTRGLDAREAALVNHALYREDAYTQKIRPFLDQLDYDETTRRAARWHIAPLVVVDPGYQFGKPIVEEAYISASILKDSYHAEDEDADEVAWSFGIEARHVQAAVDFDVMLKV